MNTNIDLSNHAKMALAENWRYALGGYGRVITPQLVDALCVQGGGVGTYNTKHRAYLLSAVGNRCSDCYGLLKSLIWWNGGNVKYDAAQDRNQEMAYAAATVKGTLASMPEISGLVLWMKGHAGIYTGDGEFIECTGAPVGMRKGKITNGKVTVGSKFTHWFKDTYIRYPDEALLLNTTVRKGDKNGVVTELQQALVSLGYGATLGDSGVDGSFGGRTEATVKTFQQENGLSADGVAGPKTRGRLKELLTSAKYKIAMPQPYVNVVTIPKTNVKSAVLYLGKSQQTTASQAFDDLKENSPFVLVNASLLGKNIISSMAEKPKASLSKPGETASENKTDSRYPKTVFGETEDSLIVIAVDGNRKNKPGMTLEELYSLVNQLSCISATSFGDASPQLAIIRNGTLALLNVPEETLQLADGWLVIRV